MERMERRLQDDDPDEKRDARQGDDLRKVGGENGEGRDDVLDWVEVRGPEHVVLFLPRVWTYGKGMSAER